MRVTLTTDPPPRDIRLFMPVRDQDSAASNRTVIEIFDEFREELDEHNDRRERLIKAGRDITNLSKKTIFLLHRIVNEESADDRALALRAAQRGREKLIEVQRIYASLKSELAGDRFWRYQRSVSPGLQEYIEALSFAHYLEHGTLVTFGQVQRTLSDDDGVFYFPLPISDYLLGLSDLTGELMRFAISGLTRKGGRSKASDVCAFVRGCKADFERLTPYIRDLSKKQAVTSESLEKIEDATYAVVVRGSEYDLPPDMLDDIVAQFISDFGRTRSDHRPRTRHRDVESGDDSGEEA